MRKFLFVKDHSLLFSLLGLLLGSVCLLFVNAVYNHSSKSYHLSHLTPDEKIDRVNAALRAVETDELLSEVDAVLKGQNEGKSGMLTCSDRLFPTLYRFSREFGYAAATWKKCQLQHYGCALALVRPFRDPDASDAVCFLPANVHQTALMGEGRCVWISNRILFIFKFGDPNGWCGNVVEVTYQLVMAQCNTLENIMKFVQANKRRQWLHARFFWL